MKGEGKKKGRELGKRDGGKKRRKNRKDGREEGIQGRKKQFNAVTYGQEAFCSLHGILGIVLCCQFESSLSYLNNLIE